MTTVDDLHYGDVIEKVGDAPGPGERFMVVAIEGEFIRALNLVEWKDYKGLGYVTSAGFVVGVYDTGLGGVSFRVIEHRL